MGLFREQKTNDHGGAVNKATKKRQLVCLSAGFYYPLPPDAWRISYGWQKSIVELHLYLPVLYDRTGYTALFWIFKLPIQQTELCSVSPLQLRIPRAKNARLAREERVGHWAAVGAVKVSLVYTVRHIIVNFSFYPLGIRISQCATETGFLP